jgi:hypothetical protein
MNLAKAQSTQRYLQVPVGAASAANCSRECAGNSRLKPLLNITLKAFACFAPLREKNNLFKIVELN